MEQEEELKAWGMSKYLNRNIITGIITLLVLSNVFLSAKWVAAESDLNNCYKETTAQEKANSAAKEAAARETAELNYKFGVLMGKIEMLEKKMKRK